MPFRKVIEEMFTSRQKHKDQSIDLLQNLVKLIMNILYAVQIREHNNESYKCKSQNWLEAEYENNVLDYWRLPKENCTVKFYKDNGLEGDNDVKKSLPNHPGALILNNSNWIMNDFIIERNGFYNNSSYYSDTDSLYI